MAYSKSKKARCRVRTEMGMGTTFTRHRWNPEGVCYRCDRAINPVTKTNKMFRGKEPERGN